MMAVIQAIPFLIQNLNRLMGNVYLPDMRRGCHLAPVGLFMSWRQI